MNRQGPAIARDRAEEALWGGLRLVVIDVETTYSKGHGTKVVAVGVVTCRAGRIHGRWSSLVNPGVPIGARFTRIHGLRDEDVEYAPTFPDIAGTLLSAFTPLPGETLVVAAHNAAFDVPVVRDELTAAGQSIPDLPILDTMGRLPELADVAPTSRSLASLLEALGLTNDNPHDALADADATARAACELLGRAAANGHMDIAAILTDIEAATTITQAAARTGRGSDDPVGAPDLPDDHLASHTTVLAATPAQRTLDRWTKSLVECARLRCSHAAGRITEAKASPDVVLPAVYDALAVTAADGDHPGTATLLHAAGGLLERVGEGRPQRTHRSHALRQYDAWTALVGDTPRCEKDQCPACRDGQPCGVDTWTYHLAGAAIGDWKQDVVWSFLPFTGIHARTGYSVWANWTKADRGPLADAALWRCYEWWTANDKAGSAALLAQVAWNAGARHPRIADAYIDAVAAGGRPADLKAAIDVADKTLATTPQLGPPEHWRALRSRRTLLVGLLDRSTVRFTGQLDEDGNPIPVRRHNPDKPRRTRPTRFLRRLGPGTGDGAAVLAGLGRSDADSEPDTPATDDDATTRTGDDR